MYSKTIGNYACCWRRISCSETSEAQNPWNDVRNCLTFEFKYNLSVETNSLKFQYDLFAVQTNG